MMPAESTLRRMRESQQKILAYQAGFAAISAVPGSGKTFTLTNLAAELLSTGRVDVNAGQSVLLVTYQNAGVENIQSRLRSTLLERDLPPLGYEVRTLHSLAAAILLERGIISGDEQSQVLGDAESKEILQKSIRTARSELPDSWQRHFTSLSITDERRQRRSMLDIGLAFISSAKNSRLTPLDLERAIRNARQEPQGTDAALLDLLRFVVDVYRRYQRTLDRNGLHDFDDLVWRAFDAVDEDPGLAAQLRQRWKFILEDEAQDSIPLQQQLIELLAGPNGNWIRAGDPNQAIMSSFTSASPRDFRSFLVRPDVTQYELTQSGRSAEPIMNAANALVDWACQEHSEPSIRIEAFHHQHLEPVPAGDPQMNPTVPSTNIRIKVFDNLEEQELVEVCRIAQRYIRAHPDHSAAILVPTNWLGQLASEQLTKASAPFDNLMRSDLSAKATVDGLAAMLSFISRPQQVGTVAKAVEAMVAFGVDVAAGIDPSDRRHASILKSLSPENFLYPTSVSSYISANVDNPIEAALERIAPLLRTVLDLRSAPMPELLLGLSDILIRVNPGELTEAHNARALAYQIWEVFRNWSDQHPEWSLADLIDELNAVARQNRALGLVRSSLVDFAPKPGRITLSTQHRAKGLEWDAVFLVGLDSGWLPTELSADFRGAYDRDGRDVKAATQSWLRQAASSENLADLTGPTKAAHIELICERLRLFYVGITRAKRILHLSRSKSAGTAERRRETGPSLAVGAIHAHLTEVRAAKQPPSADGLDDEADLQMA